MERREFGRIVQERCQGWFFDLDRETSIEAIRIAVGSGRQPQLGVTEA